MQYYKDCIKNIFGEQLFQFRTDHGMTQEAIAQELQIYPKAVSELECKKYAPSSSTLLLLFSMMSDIEILMFIQEFRKCTNHEYLYQKEGIDVKQVHYSEYLNAPEAIFYLCLEEGNIIQIQNGEQSCIMMSDRMWKLLDEAYHIFLDTVAQRKGEKIIRIY